MTELNQYMKNDLAVFANFQKYFFKLQFGWTEFALEPWKCGPNLIFGF